MLEMFAESSNVPTRVGSLEILKSISTVAWSGSQSNDPDPREWYSGLVS